MPVARAGDVIQVPLPIGGEYLAGDPTTQPDGTTRLLRNYVFRPNRLDGRPPFVYDSLMSVRSLARWEDLTNQRTTTVAMDANKIYQKPTTGVGWDAGVGSSPGTRLTDYTNYLGNMYQMYDNGAGVPNAVRRFDGTTTTTTPFTFTTLYSRTITAFIERLFFGAPRVTISPQFQNGGDAYDIGVTDVLRWKLSGITGKIVTSSTGVTCRLYLTSTTAAQFYYQRTGVTDAGNLGIINVTSSASNQSAVWRSDLRCLHASYKMPITLEIFLMTHWSNNGGAGQDWVAGNLISDGAGHLQRCITTGTGGTGAAPAWATTVGATTNDAAAVWICEGSDIIASMEDEIPTGTDESDFSTFYLKAVVPPRTNTVSLSVRCKFFNTTTPTITLAPVDVSFKDGLTDGDLRKKNRGQQVTQGDFNLPFYNCETATSATVTLEDIVFSEIGQPGNILAKNTFPLPEVAGLVTAATVCGGRYFVFKRRGMWQFARTEDPNEPIIAERPANVSYGCIGPRALDVWRDEMFWIAEDEIYRMRVGEDPHPICGDGMREEIMSKSASTWVESQATYNMPFLVVEQARQEVWVYTQKNKIYVYNLRNEQWSYLDVSTGVEVWSMIFDTIGQRMLVAWGGYGVTRFDETSTAKDSIDSTATTYSITNDIQFKPIEGFAPERPQIEIQGVNLYHNATVWPANGSLTVQYSLDRGTTWTTPTGYPLTTVTVTEPLIPMPFTVMGNSITVRLLRTGDAGAANWSVSKASAKIRVVSGEYYYVTAA